ncbi:hypothetical protein GOP47_0011597 [Adiantum capillus-veneris]|uniref:Uncharacterized protein n=1 Tax=Adiantum capillus-veneris TaxID=13818 RepID=A0A9D4ZFJ5_ADICA|nr:hypothetical protein GOP47_0011597 [Adiantum capillus-veneris]
MSPSTSPPPQSQKIPVVQDTSVLTSASDRKTSSRSVHFKDPNEGPKQMLPDSNHLATSFKNGVDKLEDQHNSRLQDDNPASLKSQIAHLKTMNKSLKLEVENLAKEKKSMFSEFSDVKRDRDQSKKRLASLEDQHIQAFKRFISRPRIVEVRQKKPNLLCRLLRRKKRPSLELVEES